MAGATGTAGTTGAGTNGLLVHYSFDEVSGTRVTDQSGNNRSGTLNGMAGLATGRSGNALSLNPSGTSGANGYLSMPEGIVAGLQSVSVSAWINPRMIGFWPRLFDFGNDTTRYMFLSSSVGEGGALRLAISVAGKDGEQRLTGPVVPINTWTHVTAVLGPTGATLYVNGVAAITDPAVTLRPSNLGSTSNNWIGRSQYSDDTYFSGLIDEFRVYSRALSAAEVAALYASP